MITRDTFLKYLVKINFCKYSDSVGPPTISLNPNVIFVNESVTLLCNVTNDGSPPASSFEWFHSSNIKFNTTSSIKNSFTVTSVLQEGNYSCAAINNLTASEESFFWATYSLNAENLTIKGIRSPVLIIINMIKIIMI